jgi:hypothetical protein
MVLKWLGGQVTNNLRSFPALKFYGSVKLRQYLQTKAGLYDSERIAGTELVAQQTEDLIKNPLLSNVSFGISRSNKCMLPLCQILQKRFCLLVILMERISSS